MDREEEGGEKSLFGNEGFCVDHARPCTDFLLPREKPKGHWNELLIKESRIWDG